MYKSFREMPVWVKAMELSITIFKITTELPRSEDYGLTSQIRRSANSVSANIAEGFGRNSNKDKSQFYIVARGSAFETQNHLFYGNKVGYFKSEISKMIITDYDELIYELNRLIKSFRN